MAIITKITTSESAKDRYNIFLDGTYAFSVDESVLVKYELRKGKEIDELDLAEIHYEDDIRKAYNDALRFLGKRMRTEGEVRKFLKEKNADDPIIQEVIHRLHDYQFLNDKEYAFAYVRTQMNTTDKGVNLIKRELLEKGVDEAFTIEALQQFSSEQQKEKAIQVAAKYMNKNHKDSHLIVKQKVEQLLLRKGYPREMIGDVMKEIEHGEKDDNREMEALRKQWEKIHRKYSHLSGGEYEQKVKQSLYRKGFSFDYIEQFLQQMKE